MFVQNPNNFNSTLTIAVLRYLEYSYTIKIKDILHIQIESPFDKSRAIAKMQAEKVAREHDFHG